MTQLYNRFDAEMVDVNHVDSTIVNSFKTLILVSDNELKSKDRISSYPPFFNNVMFIGTGDRDYIKIQNADEFTGTYFNFGVSPIEAIELGVENTLEIMECINDIKNYGDDRNFVANSSVKFVDVEITIKVKEIEMDEEFNNAKRWYALKKLDLDEIKSLGLLNDYLHLKLRFDDGKKDDDYY